MNGRNAQIAVRLAKQYAMKKSVYGWSTAVPSSIDVTHLEKVIDIAAGTCLWTLDFATMPQIRSKGDKIHIYACDINPGFIPDARVTDELGIKTFAQDATKPFPAEYHGEFDLIHASFLALCLTEEGWNSALTNFNILLSQ
jgi:ubiquinone/menaquinone biosynthesis C-methylase UbiE